jgi:hypothetical protein
MSEVITVKSARAGASTVHLAIDIGWSSPPLCGAMKTGKREFTGETANCTPCIKEAKARYIDIDGLVRISSRVWNLVNAIKAHAKENYDTGGWDVIVEAWSDHDLAEEVKTCRTVRGAVARVAGIASIYADREVFRRPLVDQPERVEPAPAPIVDSIIRWSGSAETEWYGTETWPGKVGHNDISPEGVRYVSGFHLNLTSPGACDHSSRGDGLYCRQENCRHAECVVPF